MHAALYGSDGDADDSGNLLVIETLHVPQDNHGFILLGQLVQGSGDLAVSLGLLCSLGRIRAVVPAQAAGLRGEFECPVRLIE